MNARIAPALATAVVALLAGCAAPSEPDFVLEAEPHDDPYLKVTEVGNFTQHASLVESIVDAALQAGTTRGQEVREETYESIRDQVAAQGDGFLLEHGDDFSYTFFVRTEQGVAHVVVGRSGFATA